MRRIALFLAAATIAAPAVARDHDTAPPSRDDLHAAARMLADPHVQAGVAGLLDALTDAVMQTHVGPIAILAPDVEIRPGDTLADAQRRRDPAYRQRLRAGTMGAMAVLGQAAGDAAQMSDELRATVARVQRVIEPYQR